MRADEDFVTRSRHVDTRDIAFYLVEAHQTMDIEYRGKRCFDRHLGGLARRGDLDDRAQ
jgi:hypothetical protein